MHNADLPTRAELPTTRQLVRSTLIALAAAVAILFTIVLPAEYAIDPAGVGRILGLTQMGEVKMQLAEEAARDAQAPQPQAAPQTENLAGRSDEMRLTLRPGQGAEIKLRMRAGARARFEWTVEGGVVNYDLHGDGAGNAISYQQGRAVPGHRGEFEAAFDGSHGWFWRNRGARDVTIVLRTNGEYTDIRQVV